MTVFVAVVYVVAELNKLTDVPVKLKFGIEAGEVIVWL